MNKIILFFLFIVSTQLVFGQSEEYSSLVKKADSLYDIKDFKNSALAYSAAFKSNDWKGYSDDRYNAACSWALAGNSDSAFFNLQRIADKANYSDYEHISTDEDLNSLHADERWKPLLSKIKVNKEKSEAGLDKTLLHRLDSMAKEDQKWRNYMHKFWDGELTGDSLTKETITNNCMLTDSLNYFHLKEIFGKYGFPNYDLVGEKGSSDFWLLVQHQDKHPSFQDSVLVKMKIEVDSNKASASNYAYLVDRVKVNTGQPQVYGTQMQMNSDGTSFEPRNVIEPEKLNERRKSVGLDSIESYIQMMNNHNSGSLKRK
jgi:hypothetical protein